MPKLTIDGQEVEVPKGMRVIEAAKQVGIDIPFYCYHPGLSIAGNCRMCLVEIEKMPKMQIACHTVCQDGMVVKTKTERVKQTRSHVLEFLLVNHPLDCPICDQAGECWLQDYYLNYGAYESRVNENKVKKKKAVPVGEHVMLDQERCILCSRCVRFCDEVSKTSELGITERGDHSEINVFPEKALDNPYTGNVVDICPVGALTDRDFRFKVRVWYLETKNSICNGCSRGCNIEVQYRNKKTHHAEGERVMRLKPRYNETVNKWWMCDEGRYGYKFMDKNRIPAPLKHGDQTEWDQILPEVTKNIKEAKDKVAVFVSPQLSNEELYLAKKLFKDELKLKNVFLVKPKKDGFSDDILICADKNPNSKGAESLGFKYDGAAKAFIEKNDAEGVILFGQDLKDVFGEKALENLKWSVFVGSNNNSTSEAATYVLPAAVHTEKDGTFTNVDGHTQRFDEVFPPIGESRAEWKIICDLAKELGVAMSYDYAEDIFVELAKSHEKFKGLEWAKIGGNKGDIRIFSAPMIPYQTQTSDLIFHDFKQKETPQIEAKKEEIKQ